jgi:lysine-specific demethylase/histidyl-hydroxylase NO66
VPALARCVGEPGRFAAETWGRHTHLHHEPPDADAAGFADLLTLADVDRLITSSALRVPAFRLVKDGTPLPVETYTKSGRIGGVNLTGLADPPRVLRLLDEGATLVLQGAQRYHPPLARFCRELEVALGHPSQVNVYLTPPGARGLAVHHDSHDVFVLQAFGTKHWEIHATPHEQAGFRPPQPRDVVLRPGDVLYLPKGTPHAARAQQALSGHLTVGVPATTWRAVLQRALSQALDEAPLDQPLPVGYHRDPVVFAEQLRHRITDLSAHMDKLEAHELATQFADEFLTTRAPLAGGGLVDRAKLASLHDESVVRRRAGSLCELRDSGDRLRLLLGDRELRLPRWVGPALREVVAATAEFRVADLSALDPDSRLVLIRRLVREGLLEVGE